MRFAVMGFLMLEPVERQMISMLVYKTATFSNCL